MLQEGGLAAANVALNGHHKGTTPWLLITSILKKSNSLVIASITKDIHTCTLLKDISLLPRTKQVNTSEAMRLKLFLRSFDTGRSDRPRFDELADAKQSSFLLTGEVSCSCAVAPLAGDREDTLELILNRKRDFNCQFLKN